LQRAAKDAQRIPRLFLDTRVVVPRARRFPMTRLPLACEVEEWIIFKVRQSIVA
jgi:hypothetical protein